MKRFMLLMIPQGYEKAPAGAMPDARRVEAMSKYNDELEKAGVLLSVDGLQPPSMGARVHFHEGNAEVEKGPFDSTKETIGGYWVIRARSKEEAIEWAMRCPAAENEVIEVRQVQEFEEFPDDVRAAISGRAETYQRGDYQGA